MTTVESRVGTAEPPMSAAGGRATATVPRVSTLDIDVSIKDALRISDAAVSSAVPKPAKIALLIAVLTGQALLTVRLIHPHYASGDEGRYIYAGHQLIHELWHGGGSPFYENYFSGAPVIYPVIAAMADHVGGLVAVRLMSLVFMLAATVTLFAATRRLFGYSSAILAATLFAGLGLTQDLGALATSDAMALMLMAAAAYCAARTRDNSPHATFWLLALPVVLLLANCTKYMTVLFDPVVIALAALQVRGGWCRALTRCTALSAAVALALALALALAGGSYLRGVLFSTVARPPGTNVIFDIHQQTPRTIALDTWQWIGVTIVGSIIALAAALLFRKDKKAAATVALFMLASVVVTVAGLHLQTDESLRKHDDFSAWFACANAGSIASYIRFRARSALGTLAGAGMLAAAVASGAHYSKLAGTTFEAGGPQTTLEVAATLRPYLASGHYRYLLGGFDNEQLLYLDHSPVRWFDNTDDVYIKYPIPGRGGDEQGQTPGRTCFGLAPGCRYLEGMTGYRMAIHAHWFALISLWGGHGTPQDAEIAQAVEDTPGYVLLTRIGRAPTWVYAPDYPGLVNRSPERHSAAERRGHSHEPRPAHHG
ncbi:MAG TPA: glycosyltransferase family 39 protein [Streptosporangiaceae bacterium]|nr:glycosyltransferase family 39 protein [Streptosporangiaceae bacterium]